MRRRGGDRRLDCPQPQRQLTEPTDSGVKAAQAVRTVAARCGVEMPITDQVHAVLYEGRDVREAVRSLMGRGLKRE